MRHAIRLLRELGTNYAMLRFEGGTAMDFAKQAGDPELMQALGSKGSAL